MFHFLILTTMLTKQERKEANAISQAKGLAKWLEVDFQIKIFGFTILEYHFPPKEKLEN